MHRAVLSPVLIATQHVGSLAQSGSHCSARDESTWQLTWCIMSGCWLAEQVCLYSCGRHRQPSHRRLKESEKGGDGGHSAAVNIVFHHTRWWWWWWCNILTKNTPPSTFRARLPVTLVKWIILFITSVDKNLFDSPNKTMGFLSGRRYLNCVHVLFWRQQTSESSFTVGRCKMAWSAVWFRKKKSLDLSMNSAGRQVLWCSLSAEGSMNNMSHCLRVIPEQESSSVLWFDTGSVYGLPSLGGPPPGMH